MINRTNERNTTLKNLHLKFVIPFAFCSRFLFVVVFCAPEKLVHVKCDGVAIGRFSISHSYLNCALSLSLSLSRIQSLSILSVISSLIAQCILSVYLLYNSSLVYINLFLISFRIQIRTRFAFDIVKKSLFFC